MSREYGVSTHKCSIWDVVRFLFPYVLMFAGLIGLGYPVATEMWESYQAQQGISRVTGVYGAMNEPERTSVESEAISYNDALYHGHDLSERLPYEEQLSFDNADMISYLSIPKLSIKLPVYHGTDENTLMIGVGHVEGTALPVGGVGRCVLAGHSGMPNARMFDDIHLLEKGDQFVLWTLGKAYAYEVIESVVVLPEETDRLYPDGEQDLVTLVTCTPYGVNSHRLLVTGKRCEYVEDMEVVPAPEVYFNRRTIPFLIGMGAILVMFVVNVIWRTRRYLKRRDT